MHSSVLYAMRSSNVVSHSRSQPKINKTIPQVDGSFASDYEQDPAYDSNSEYDSQHIFLLETSRRLIEFDDSIVRGQGVLRDGALFNGRDEVLGGPLPALVAQLTTDNAIPNTAFVISFFLTFRLFTNASELTYYLISRFEDAKDPDYLADPVRLRVYNTFKNWMMTSCNDKDSRALPQIMGFSMGQLKEYLPRESARLLELAEKLSGEVHEHEERTITLPRDRPDTQNSVIVEYTTPLTSPTRSRRRSSLLKLIRISTPDTNFRDFEPADLANVFTKLASEMFCAIKPFDLLDLESTTKGIIKAPRALAMSTFATKLTNLVTDTILKLDEAKRRAKMLRHWLEVGQQCLELQNYAALMAIMSALELTMITRLEKSWDLLPTKVRHLRQELRPMIHSARNYEVLRQRLSRHTSPCIPPVGVFLTDLTIINASNDDMRSIPGEGDEIVSIINFEKYHKMAEVVLEAQRFQIRYSIVSAPDLQRWFEEEMERVSGEKVEHLAGYQRSLELEPEKD